MVRLGTYESMYVEGAKKVNINSFFARKEGRVKAFGNYYLLFAKEGQLLMSVHNEEHKNYEINYNYDSKGNFLISRQWNSDTRELEEINEFTYDRKGRLQTEKCRSFYPELERKIVNQQIFHIYRERTEITILTSDEEDQYTTYCTYDNLDRLIEAKSFLKRDGLHMWIRYEYDDEDNHIRTIWLDNKGELYFAHEYLPRINGLFAGYQSVSLDRNYLREYEFELNERGHWIKEVVLDDGVPRNICERIIEYY